MIGGTREGEYQRSAELYIQLAKENSPYCALAFLYDAQYDREDIKRILEILEKHKLYN